MAKVVSTSKLDEILAKYIKSAIEILTQVPDMVPGCACFRIIQLKPPQVSNFDYAETIDIIRAKMPLVPNCEIKLCDSFITTFPNEIFIKFMEYAALRSNSEYKDEQYDCDDFSMTFASLARKWQGRLRAAIEEQPVLKQMLPPAKVSAHVAIPRAQLEEKMIGGSPVGMCHGRLSAKDGEHAFNFWINEKKEIIFIEPQSCEYIVLGDGARIDFVYL